jgi:hypothetical protein
MPPGQLSAKAQATLGLPDGFKTFGPYPFEGMNVQSSAIALKDTEFTWLENFAKLGDGNLRTMWDIGTTLYTGSIVYYSFYTIGANYYCIIFHSDGTATQINTTTLVQTTITPNLAFYTNSGFIPYAKQWGTQYLLISNRNTMNDYWAWDGSLLYGAGTVAPDSATILAGGFDYSTVPSYTVYGGFGSGVALTPVVSGGQVVELTITNPGNGYQPGDVVQVAFSGGGATTTPILTAQLAGGGGQRVSSVTVTNGGSGYVNPTIVFSGGGGTGAAAAPAEIGGVIRSITVTSSGSGYSSTPTVSIVGGGGTGGTATANMSGPVGGGSVGGVTITAGGTGYTSPTVTFSGGGGTGAAATAVETGGVVTSITVTSGGSGYVTAPTVTIHDGGPGTGATAISVLAPVGVGGVTVVNGGTGFTSVPLISFVGGGGAGATGVAVLAPTSIARINVTAGGSGYSSAPTVTIGGGAFNGVPTSVATATAVLDGNSVGQVIITSAGSGYTAPCEVLFSGGSGAGAGAVAVYNPTSIASVAISSSGQFYTSAPAVVVSPGANGSAYASLALMPYGVSGSAMETYLSRVWIVNPAQQRFTTLPPGGDWQVSAPGSLTDFATSDGGVQAVNADSFLQVQYTNVHQSSGYLYFFGDGSVSVVSNVSTSEAQGSSVVSTQYNYQNVDPQSGTPWRDTLQDFGRSSIVTNSTGVYGLYGGTLSKISGKLDQLFTPAAQGGLFVPPSAGGIVPTSAIATIFNIKHYMVLLTLLDPDTAQQRNVMVTWNEKDWTINSQSVSLTSISTQKVGSSYFAFGSDGVKIYPLFAKPSVSLTKRFDTKQYGADRPYIQKIALAAYMQAQDNSLTQSGVGGTFSVVSSGIALQNAFAPTGASQIWNNTFRIQPAFSSSPPFFGLWGTSMGGMTFITMGVRFTSTSPDFTLGNFVIGYKDETAYFGQ